MLDLKKFRKTKNISQAEIAEKLGVTQVHISNIENGNRKLTDAQYSILTAIYGAEELEKYYIDDDIFGQIININKNQGGYNFAGEGNFNAVNSDLMEVLKEQTRQITKFQDQISRLISLLEKQTS